MSTSHPSARKPSRTNKVLRAGLASFACGSALASAQNTTTGSTSLANKFVVVGTSGVSAQQLFRGQGNKVSAYPYVIDIPTDCIVLLSKVYILDKTENNPQQINGHPGAYGLVPNTQSVC